MNDYPKFESGIEVYDAMAGLNDVMAERAFRAAKPGALIVDATCKTPQGTAFYQHMQMGKDTNSFTKAHLPGPLAMAPEFTYECHRRPTGVVASLYFQRGTAEPITDITTVTAEELIKLHGLHNAIRHMK